MELEEFLKANQPEAVETNEAMETAEESTSGELDIQRAVVESLAADKAAQDEELRQLRQAIAIKDGQIKAQEAMMTSLHGEIATLKSALAEVTEKLSAEKMREYDQQERNPNALALLDRDVELPDRYPGESRDHVLEVLSEARKKAEEEGRVRRAQILESVLVANEPNGTKARRQAELEKLFSDNANILNGPVLDELNRLGISHKNGEDYLLPSEILKRNF